MGILSDPSLTPRNVIAKSFAKHNRKICVALYILGIAWFVCLSHSDFNHSTYLSENALSPGLVYPEVRVEVNRAAASFLEELYREHKTHHTTTPYAWIAAKMQQIGLETHVHNFTLRHPFSASKAHHGKNIYGILRAPRVASTEGIVFSAPYRPPTSAHADITASVPVLLAFAEFARTKNYWAKDLIFLVTEMEQLGMHAWLEAYHEGDLAINSDAALDYGNLPARSGALQAALNLEIQDLNVDYIDVKLHGLNGKLPNLDMFNLVQRITSREGIPSGYQYSAQNKWRSSQSSILQNLRSMTAMLLSQASGVPNGNHGLFHRYRIEALTLEAVKRTTQTSKGNTVAMPLLKTIEGISRSLNNLLERFHQSFFFYIIVQNDRFVSIGDYMPCLAALTAALFIKAFLTWISYNEQPQIERKNVRDVNADEASEVIELPYMPVLFYALIVLTFGYLSYQLPLLAQFYFHDLNIGLSTRVITFLSLWIATVLGALVPLVFSLPKGSIVLLHVGLLTYLGVMLIVVGLLNFALGFFLATIVVPFLILMQPEKCANLGKRFIHCFCTILLNPLVVVYILVLALTYVEFPELSIVQVLHHGGNAAMDAITFALADWMIYGNWLYVTSACVLFPAWLILWTIVVNGKSSVHVFQATKVASKID